MKITQIFLTTLAIFSVSAVAAPIVYTSTYWPTAMPATGSGTVENPAFSMIDNGGSGSVSGGFLHGNTMPDLAPTQYWLIGNSGGTNHGTHEAWSVNQATGATVDFAVAIHSATPPHSGSPQNMGGFSIVVSDGQNWAGIFFDTTKISLWGNTIQFSEARDNTELQTYRIVIQGGIISLYEAGFDDAIFDSEDMASGGENNFYFGDGSSLVSGSYDLAFLGWNNTLAEFSAPLPVTPIPEPAIGVLLGLSAAAGLWLRRRKGRDSELM